ncbi:hypothetical protein [Epilithonimonas sp.]|uniref:hypothetical protein n=1 Tax=Epilithonimonas sp. TaxID=2894511 RepID=UPI002FDCFA77
MTNFQKEIINILSDYASKNPNQRFGQMLFNLDINNFKNEKNEVKDIYNDSDEEILNRIKERLKRLNSDIKN